MKFKLVKLMVLLGSLIFLTACGSAPATSWPATTTDGQNIFLSNGSYVYSVNGSSGVENTIATADGNVAARFPQKASGSMSFFAPATITSDGQMLIGNSATKSHNFFKVDPKTGNITWSFDAATNTWMAGALTLGDTIFAPSGDGNLYLLDVKTGAPVKDPIKLSEHSLWITPKTNGDLVYVVTMDHEILAINHTGEKVWSQILDTSILGAPLVVENNVYVGTLSGTEYALDGLTGDIKWKTALQGNIWGTAATDGKALYVGTVVVKTGKFYSLNLADGSILWQKDEDGSIIASPVVINDQVLYATELGKLQSLDSAGTPKWQAVIENAHFYTTPLLFNDSIVMAPMNSDYMMVAYDLNGAQRWTFQAK